MVGRPAVTEDQLQRAAFDYLRYAVPHALVWHCPNGGSRNRIEAAKLKGMGVVRGVPDLAILSDRGFHFIEIKVGKNKVTTEQDDFMAQARALGADTAICRSLDDVTLALRTWRLIP